MKIPQISDIHLTGDDRLLFGSSPRDRLAAAIHTIRREHADARLCLFTGDLAEGATIQAYRQLADLAADLAAGLPMPCRFLAGNHDARSVLVQALPPEHSQADGFLQQAVDTEQGRFLLQVHQSSGGARPGHPFDRRTWCA